MIKILIADDEGPEREMLGRICNEKMEEEVELRFAENGSIAVTIATLWHPDIILMDIEMPVLSGLEASKQILNVYPDTKIIVITAYSLFSYARDAVKLGVSDYILKPVDSDDVVKAVRQAFLQLEAIRQLKAVANEFSEPIEEDSTGDKANQIIQRVKKYIQHNYMTYDLSLDTVSDILNINPSYLSSLFKKCTGVNFVDYITDIRIRNAKKLLSDPLRSASEIADIVGYESASYFSRAFKKNTGMTPTEYRRSIRGGAV